MTTPLTGLSGLATLQTLIDDENQATPEERMGGPVDPAHSKGLAEDYIPRGSRIGPPTGPFGPDNQLLGDETWFWESGGSPLEDPDFDHTPSTRAGPWPKGILSGPVGGVGPDDEAPKLEQLAGLHGIDTNAEARFQYRRDEPLNDEWQTLEQINSGNTLTESGTPKQLLSSGFGWGTRDRVQSMAGQNEYGFDSAHQHRRWAVGSIPGNNYWMRPGGRLMMKSLAGPARPPIGENSPFTGQDLGAAFGIDGAVLQNVPGEYVAPPTPQLAKATVSATNDSIVEWY